MTPPASVRRSLGFLALWIAVFGFSACLFPSAQADEKKPPAEPEKAAQKTPAAEAEKKPAEPNNKPRNPLSDLLNDLFMPSGEKKKAEKQDQEKPPANVPPAIAPPPQRELTDPRGELEESDPRIPDPQGLRKMLRDVYSNIEKQRWKAVAQQLQYILKAPEDTLIRGSRKNWGSLQAEAQRLLRQLPAEELQNYRTSYEGIARKQLDTAVAAGDYTAIINVAHQYFPTEAGQEAADRVASRYLERGDYGLADYWFSQLAAANAGMTQSATWQTKAALAKKFSNLAGFTAEGQTFEGFAEKEPLKLGGERQPVAEWLRQASLPNPAPQTLSEWIAFLGNSSRTGRPTGGEPLLLSRWYQPLTHSHRLETSIRHLVEDLTSGEHVAIPTLMPLMVKGKLLFRTLHGVRVVDAATGEAVWETQDRVSAEELLANSPQRQPRRGRRMFVGFRSSPSVDYHQNPLTNLLFEDANYGFISSDGERLFVLEELALFTKRPQQYWGSNESTTDQLGQDWTSNKLVAYDLETGRPQWEIGGTLHGDAFELPLAGHFFHGAPLADGGELFVIGEQDRLIQLFCLSAATGEVLWRQPVAQATAEISRDIVRRWYGAQIAIGNGVIVCQTSTGLVAAVERESHNLLWTVDTASLNFANTRRMRGRSNDEIARMEPLNKRWYPTPPIIVGNRVVVAAPRSKYVHGLQLITGNEEPRSSWQVAKKDELLFVAGVDDERVIVVGQNRIEARQLDRGSMGWVCDLPDPPCGCGVMVGELYYLPLSSGELWGVNLESGEVVERMARPAGSRPLGNLAMYRGRVISLSPFGVESFEQRESVEQEIAQRKQSTPNDPLALLREAEIAELNRDTTLMLANLRKVDPQGLSDVERQRYSEVYLRALVGLIRSDFLQHDTAVAELNELVATPEEQLVYLRLIADRQVARGEYAAALDVYLKLSEIADGRMISVPENSRLSVRDEYWLAGRIRDLRGQLPEEHVPAFDQRIAELAAEVVAEDAESQIRWLKLFGFHPAALPVQRQLVEYYANQQNLIAAETLLLRIRRGENKAAAAEAVNRWGELLLAAGSAEGAADAYDLLQREYGEVKLPDGRSGQKVAEAARNEHQLPSGLKQHSSLSWKMDALTVERMGPDYSQQEFSLPLEGIRSGVPYFDRRQMHVSSRLQRLEILPTDGESRPVSIALRGVSPRPEPGLAARNQGHHLLLLYQGSLQSVSPLEEKVRWARPVKIDQPTQTYSSNSADHYQMRSSLDQLFKKNRRQAKNTFLFDDDHFVYRSRRRITALDTLTGEVCWTMENVPLDSDFFGGDGVLYQQLDKPVQRSHVKPLYAYRIIDGKQIELPKSTSRLTGHDKQFVGRYVLQGTKVGEEFQMQLTDPLTEQKIWSRSFSHQTLALDHGVDQFLIVTPDGKFSRLDLKSGETSLLGQVDEATLKSRKSAYCLIDNENAYLIINWANRQVNARYSNNMAAIQVSGKIMAFDLNTQHLRWTHQVAEPCNLLLTSLDHSPVALFTKSENKTIGRRPRTTIRRMNLMALNKQNGDVLLDETVYMQPSLQNLRIDWQGKYIELRTYNERVRMTPRQSKIAKVTAPTGG